METDETCSVCLEVVESNAAFRSHCAKPHAFHYHCIHSYAKHCLASAVQVSNGAVRVKHSALARCPVCRAEMTWAHRSSQDTSFFLVGGSQALLELGTVRVGKDALQLTTRSYKRARSLA